MHLHPLSLTPLPLLIMNNKGSASVFLLLIFIVLLGAIGILLECARNEGMKSYSEDIVSSSADTLMTEYYRPLWDEYHVLFMAFANGENQADYMKGYIEQYMQYSLDPRRDMTKLKVLKYGHSIINPKVSDIEVKDIRRATDDEGMVYQKEAVSYMKYKGLEKSFEVLKEFMGKVNTVKPAAEILQEKMDCEEQLQQVNGKNLELIRVIDGIRMEGRDDYKVHVEPSFAKQLVNGTATMSVVGINNDYMWTKLRNKYVNVNSLLSSLRDQVDYANELSEQIDKLEEEYRSYESNKEEGNNKKREDLQQEIEEYSEEYSQLIGKMEKTCERFSNYIEKVQYCMEQACQIVKGMQKEQQCALAKQEKYRLKLEKEKSSVSQELYQGLMEDYEDMKNVVVGGLDCESLLNILKNNLMILKQVHGLDNITVSSSTFGTIKYYAVTYIELFKEYSMSGITFKYGVSSRQEKIENPISKIKEMTESGIMHLVLPDSIQVSNKELSIEVTEADEEQQLQVQGTIEGLDLVKNLKNVFKLFTSEQSLEFDDISGIPDIFLMLFYEEEHFKNLLEEEAGKERCLEYEEEYLLSGQRSDKNNLEAVIDKVIIWRTVSNFISIMADREKRKMAYETALLIAGVTGIEPLVHVTQTLILVVWSLEEAMVDTAIMLQGKEVELIKNGKSFAIAYEQLLLMNHQKIQELASKAGKVNGATVSYEQFLRVLLFLGSGTSTRLRAMDLVNGNIAKWYTKEFHLSRCVYSYTVGAKVELYKPYIQGVELGNYMVSLKKSY